MKKRAFTLVELLAVISIIAVLLAILMPSLRKAKEMAARVACLSNQKQLGLAWVMYAQDNDNRIVYGGTLAVEELAVAESQFHRGETPWAFVRLKNEEPSDKLSKELMDQVVKVLGPTCRPDRIIFAKAVPRTRSGKIMRRILKSLVKDEPIGDTTTIENPECVEKLKKLVGYKGTG